MTPDDMVENLIGQKNKTPALLLLAERGVPLPENENAVRYLNRVREVVPAVIPDLFPDEDTALDVLSGEIDALTLIVHDIRVKLNLVQEHHVSGTMICAIARTSGVKILPDDVGSAWLARVETEAPGVTHFLSRSHALRAQRIDQGMIKFHQDVLTARANLIASLLFIIAPLISICAMQVFDFRLVEAAQPMQSALPWMFGLMSLVGVWMTRMSLRIRKLYASAETSPIWI